MENINTKKNLLEIEFALLPERLKEAYICYKYSYFVNELREIGDTIPYFGVLSEKEKALFFNLGMDIEEYIIAGECKCSTFTYRKCTKLLMYEDYKKLYDFMDELDRIKNNIVIKENSRNDLIIYSTKFVDEAVSSNDFEQIDFEYLDQIAIRFPEYYSYLDIKGYLKKTRKVRSLEKDN